MFGLYRGTTVDGTTCLSRGRTTTRYHISKPGSFYALPLLVFVVGPPSCTVVDFGPSSAGCRLTAPGAGGVVCCGPPTGVPRAAPSARALPASAPALPPVLSILDGNSSCVVVWFPDGPAAAPAAEFAVCGRPPWPMVSASAGFCDALRLRPGSLVPFSPFTIFRLPSTALDRGSSCCGVWWAWDA